MEKLWRKTKENKNVRMQQPRNKWENKSDRYFFLQNYQNFSMQCPCKQFGIFLKTNKLKRNRSSHATTEEFFWKQIQQIFFKKIMRTFLCNVHWKIYRKKIEKKQNFACNNQGKKLETNPTELELWELFYATSIEKFTEKK